MFNAPAIEIFTTGTDESMTDILNRRLVPSEQALESRVGDETVLLHLENGAYYGIDPIGTRIWQLLKEGHDPLAICGAITLEYEVAPDVAESDVRRFLSDLMTHAIVIDV